jgi:rod shape-determining protein MreD
MIDTIKYSLLGFVVLIFQWMLGDLFNISGITPSFLVIYIIYLGLIRSQTLAIWLGFVFGLTIDALTSTHLMGITALSLSLVGYLSGVFHGRIVRIPIILQYLLHVGFLAVFFSLTVLISLQNSDWSIGNIVFLILIPKTLYTLGVLGAVFTILRVGAE